MVFPVAFCEIQQWKVFEILENLTYKTYMLRVYFYHNL